MCEVLFREPLSAINFLVGAGGFEPPASCSQSKRATRLRYAPPYPAGKPMRL